MLAGAVAGFAIGSLWAIWFPINKRVWTSSYVLFAAGWTLLILFISYLMIDIKKHQGSWTYPWKVFGSNTIFAYAFSELLSIVLGVIRIGSDGNTVSVSLKGLIYTRIFALIPDPSFGSLLYSLSFVMVCFIPCLVLFTAHLYQDLGQRPTLLRQSRSLCQGQGMAATPRR